MADLKPKVFISYTWSNNDYINKVTNFVNRLVQDGIDVLFDQFEMKPGKSLNNYMEKCVNDQTVTKVLILLSPDYKEKADSRKGGTGIETQIISQEVYSNLDNEKFIPILFETRGKNVSECIPTYLKDRFRLDLSNADIFEEMYMAVVRCIYGVNPFIKPELGNKPNWVESKSEAQFVKLSFLSKMNELKKTSTKDTILYISQYLKNLIENVCSNEFPAIDQNNFENEYKKFNEIKTTYIVALNECANIDNVEDLIFKFYRILSNHISFELYNYDSKSVLIKIFKHETIIETIAILYKNENFTCINSLINSSYIINRNSEVVDFKNCFYSLSNSFIYQLDEVLGFKYREGTDVRKYTGIGHYWMKNIPEPYINKDEFSYADVLITNIISGLYTDKFGWFPLTYIYTTDDCEWIKEIAISLKSIKLSKRFLPLFGVDNLEQFKSIYKNILECENDRSGRLAYPRCFRSAPLLSMYLEEKDIGFYR